MKLNPHGRYDYSAIIDRPRYCWPNGASLAVFIATNVEHFAFGEGLQPGLSTDSPPPNHRAYAWRDYGTRVGVWRLCEIFDSLGITPTVLVNSSVFSHCPRTIDPFRELQAEFVGHGRTNSERQADMDEQSEALMIKEVNHAFLENIGHVPSGWLSPWVAQSFVTPDLLSEAGYKYMLDWHFDDQPMWFNTRARRLLAIPYPMELNDITSIIQRFASHREFEEMITDAFDEQLEQSKKYPIAMGITTHPQVVGQPFRLRALRTALSHVVARRGDIWLATPGQIHDHIASIEALKEDGND